MEELEAKKVVEAILEDHQDLFLVNLKLKGTVGNRRLLTIIDGDAGVTIDTCAQLSRLIGSVLEEKEVIDGKYTLEISSPGLDFPLLHTRQYKKNIGRELAIKLKEGQLLEGKLLEVEDTFLTLNQAEQLKNVDFEEIEETKVKISFK